MDVPRRPGSLAPDLSVGPGGRGRRGAAADLLASDAQPGRPAYARGHLTQAPRPEELASTDGNRDEAEDEAQLPEG